MSCGGLLHSAGSGMKAQLQLIEGKPAFNWNRYFSIENELLLWQLRHTSNDIGKITRKRLAVF